MADPRRLVDIDYTNWRGERRVRRIHPLRVAFENSEWHPEQQWVLYAAEERDGRWVERGFALANIHSWRPVAPHGVPQVGSAS